MVDTAQAPDAAAGITIKIPAIWLWWIVWSVAPPLIVAGLRAIGVPS